MSESTCPHCQHLTAVEAQIGEGKPYPQMIIPISIRDWFAGMALQGLLGGSLTEDEVIRREQKDWLNHLAPLAYAYADAMIAQREAP